MRSVPGADRGPRAGSPRGVVVATGSQHVMRIEIARRDPVATAPGTDLMPKVDTLNQLWRFSRRVVGRLTRIVICRRADRFWGRPCRSALSRSTSRARERNAFALTRTVGDHHLNRTEGAVVGLVGRVVADDVLGPQIAYNFVGYLRQFGN